MTEFTGVKLVEWLDEKIQNIRAGAELMCLEAEQRIEKILPLLQDDELEALAGTCEAKSPGHCWRCEAQRLWTERQT